MENVTDIRFDFFFVFFNYLFFIFNNFFGSLIFVDIRNIEILTETRDLEKL